VKRGRPFSLLHFQKGKKKTRGGRRDLGVPTSDAALVAEKGKGEEKCSLRRKAVNAGAEGGARSREGNLPRSAAKGSLTREVLKISGESKDTASTSCSPGDGGPARKKPPLELIFLVFIKARFPAPENVLFF